MVIDFCVTRKHKEEMKACATDAQIARFDFDGVPRGQKRKLAHFEALVPLAKLARISEAFQAIMSEPDPA